MLITNFQEPIQMWHKLSIQPNINIETQQTHLAENLKILLEDYIKVFIVGSYGFLFSKPYWTYFDQNVSWWYLFYVVYKFY